MVGLWAGPHVEGVEQERDHRQKRWGGPPPPHFGLGPLNLSQACLGLPGLSSVQGAEVAALWSSIPAISFYDGGCPPGPSEANESFFYELQ